MPKTYLFAGASSAIAQVLAEKLSSQNHKIIGLSTKNLLSDAYENHFQVNSYSKNDLPDILENIDGLVYFPGSINLKPFNRITEDDFLNEYKLNSLGAVNVIQKYLPNLKNASSASIVLISTVAATQGMPYHASISMAKGAIEGLTLSLAAELAPTIRVNAVAPALTATPLAEKLINSNEKLEASNKRHPLKRIGQPQDISNAISFLLGDESDWITGQILNVDGGMSSVRIL
jgi:3-oxoacyl-[acyl-carrier protein] reductase